MSQVTKVMMLEQDLGLVLQTPCPVLFSLPHPCVRWVSFPCTHVCPRIHMVSGGLMLYQTIGGCQPGAEVALASEAEIDGQVQ